MAVGQEEGRKWLGHIHVCAGGWGGAGRRTGNSLPPLPQLPFPSISAGHPLSGSQGVPDSGPTWTGVWGAAGVEERDLTCVPSRGGGERSPPHPLQGLVDTGACTLAQAILLPSGGKGQRKQILAKVTAGRGLSAMGSPSIQGVNRLGFESPRIPTSFLSPWPERHPLEFPARLLFFGTHTSSGHTHSEGPSCLLRAHLLCCQTLRPHTHAHTHRISPLSLSHTQNHSHISSVTYSTISLTHPPLVIDIYTHMHTHPFPFHTPWVSYTHILSSLSHGHHPSFSLLHTLVQFTHGALTSPRHTLTFPCRTHPL